MFRNVVQPAQVRARLEQFAADNDVPLTELSRYLRRGPNYVQRFIAQGVPAKLDEDDRLALARYFGVDERELGAREPWVPPEYPRRKRSSAELERRAR